MKKGLYEFMDYLPFLKEIIKRDFKKKYYNSILGVAWTILSPLLMMAVMTLIFSTLFSRSIENYPVYWLSGNMLYGFLFSGSDGIMNCISANASLVKKKRIPKYIFCIATITQQTITMFFSTITFIVVSLLTGVRFGPFILLIPLPIIMTYVFTLGLGMFLCAYGTFFKDLHYLYSVIRRLFMYLTPIMYPITIIPENYRFLWELNPLCVYITIFRDLSLYNTLPSEKMLIVGTIYSLLMLGLGIVTFKEKEDRFFLYI